MNIRVAQSFLVLATSASLFLASVDATSVKMDYLPSAFARVDPILSSTCPSDHVHTFYGPLSGVDPRRIDQDNDLELHSLLLSTPVSENTGNVEENKSLYWHPTVYKVKDGVYTRAEMAQSSVYYIWETGLTTAFPAGFRMIGGFQDTNPALAECVNPSPCDPGDCETENTFFPSTKCDELEVSMRMPSCWDGVSVSSPPEHTSHVVYPNEEDECPPSHPVAVPRIDVFFRIAPYDGGHHTFSDGSSVFHSDYVSGWDEAFLQDLLNNCDNDGFAAMPNFFCEDRLTFRDGPKCTDEETCDFGDPALLEKLRAIQPEVPLDVKGSIIAEETEVVEELPRGTCNGELVGSEPTTTSTTSTSTGTSASTTSSTSTSTEVTTTTTRRPSETGNQMVKMCLFYSSPSGHARSDPIISQDCSSAHMHTFYGPRSIHPTTTYDDLRSTPPFLSTSPVRENQSLYWHPSIYRVVNGEHILVRDLDSSPYYRWDRSVNPVAEPFPPGFRMIAASDDPGANGCGPSGNCNLFEDPFHAMFTECCNIVGEEENCQAWEESNIVFPTQSCDFFGIALAMPTCWDGRIDSDDHKSHMAYTLGGQVAGPCPAGYNRRLPQIQLFVRINNYQGGTYVLSDLKNTFHVDFFNGWEEGKLGAIMDTCQPQSQGVNEYNPPCDCTPQAAEEDGTYDGGLTENSNIPDQICDADVRRLIVDEPYDRIPLLPVYGGSCQGEPMIERTWATGLSADLFSADCNNPITTTSTSSSTTSTAITTSTSVPETTTTTSTSTTTTTSEATTQATTTTSATSTTSTTSATTTTTTTSSTSASPTTAKPSPAPTGPSQEDNQRIIACGSGGGRLRCPEKVALADANEDHGVRCCRDCVNVNNGSCDPIWKRKCAGFDEEVFGTSYVGIDESCRKLATFQEALNLCEEMEGGRLCTEEEVVRGCTKGTGCSLNKEMVWTCMYNDGECEEDMECCSGSCNAGFCEE